LYVLKSPSTSKKSTRNAMQWNALRALLKQTRETVTLIDDWRTGWHLSRTSWLSRMQPVLRLSTDERGLAPCFFEPSAKTARSLPYRLFRIQTKSTHTNYQQSPLSVVEKFALDRYHLPCRTSALIYAFHVPRSATRQADSVLPGIESLISCCPIDRASQ
jgi:hypothetical protein